MIRIGYLRFEIDAAERRSIQDNRANELEFTARPTYRNVRIKWSNLSTAEKNFINGNGNLAAVLAARQQEFIYDTIRIPDVGPRQLRYSLSDRDSMPRFWIGKIKNFASTFAAEVVDMASSFRQLVIENPILRGNYARLVQEEIMRRVNGKSESAPTIEDRSMEIDATQHVEKGLPELVAAELVRDVFDTDHFQEFACKNHVTIRGGDGNVYRIPRRTHGLIEVWDEHRKPKCRLCVVFRDPGMPPSDEVVMKYLLVKHDIKKLWEIAVQFSFNSAIL